MTPMTMDFIELVVVAVACSWFAYRIGYGQGRNDGFHAGWRECQKQKRIRIITHDPD